jgi:hypothetical protein
MCIHNGIIASVCNQCNGALWSGIVGHAGIMPPNPNGYMVTTPSAFYDSDWEMFKVYAELDDGDLVKKYYDEQQQLRNQGKIQMQIIEETLKNNLSSHQEKFFAWISKYRKSLSKERILNLKAFL